MNYQLFFAFLQFVLNFYLISSHFKIFTVPSISNEKMLFFYQNSGNHQIFTNNVSKCSSSVHKSLSLLLTPFKIMSHCNSKLMIFIVKVCLDSSAFKLEMVRIARAFWHNDRSRSTN